MNNTLTITFLNDGRVQTDITFYDGSTSMEIHRQNLHDSKVLRKMQEKKYYQHKPGEWILVFPDDNKVIRKATFDEAIEAAQEFIFERDNTTDYSGFC